MEEYRREIDLQNNCNQTQIAMENMSGATQVNNFLLSRHAEKMTRFRAQRFCGKSGYDRNIDTSEDEDGNGDSEDQIGTSDEEFINDKSMLRLWVVKKKILQRKNDGI